MDELARLMDWDLRAATVGCSSEAAHLSFSSVQDDRLLCNFQEFSETKTVVDELEELYKPFYPDLPDSVPEEVKPTAVLQDPASSKCKRSKKNEKKMKRVEHVRGDGVSDPWAWRKYGQKPIKGSPYPRSYYRCSSSKGCSARKQVERSHTDPQVFIVTYTAEHTHPPHPITRRSKNTIAPNNATSHDPPAVADVPNNTVLLEERKIESREDDDWFPSMELEELNGFMDTTFADTWFADQCN